MKTLSTLFLLVALLTAYGCGASFTCPAPHGGMKCSSVSTVYEKALSGGLVTSSSREAYVQKQSGNEEAIPPEDRPSMLARPEKGTISAKLETDKMVPLRIPPKIIRMWFSPWEDDDGDLNQGGYVFSEITDPKNRWVVGEGSPKGGAKDRIRFFSGKMPSKHREGAVERDRLMKGDAPARKERVAGEASGKVKRPARAQNVRPSVASGNPSTPDTPEQKDTGIPCAGSGCPTGEKPEK